MKRLFLSIMLICIYRIDVISQTNSKNDSLKNELKKYENSKQKSVNKSPQLNDSVKVNLLLQLYTVNSKSAPEQSLAYLKQALTLSENIAYSKGVGNALIGLGRYYMEAFQYPEALVNFEKAIKVKKERGDKKGMARSYYFIGNIYDYQGNYPEALKNHLAALKIYEEINDSGAMANSYQNIGLINEILENFNEALRNYNEGLKISKEIGSDFTTTKILNCIGNLNRTQGKYEEAIKYLKASLILAEKNDFKEDICYAFGNIGIVYYFQGNYPEAIKYYLKALEIMEEIGDKDAMSGSYINIGNLYKKQKKYKEALHFTTKGLELARTIGRTEWVKNAYMNISQIDSALHDFDGAYHNYKLYSRLKDSMFNIEKDKKITALQLTFKYERKQDSIKAEQKRKDALSLKEIQKQKYVRNGFIGGFAVVLLFAASFLRQRNKIKKAKSRSDELLLNILPEEVAEELKQKGSTEAKLYNNVTVLFTDFVNFTGISEQMSPTELVQEIHKNFIAFDAIIERNGLEKIKTIGDAYMAVCGLPNESERHAQRVVNAALEIQEYILKNHGKFQIRIGINSGPVVAGIVGVKKFAYDIWGDTVNTANRMESSSEAGEINISESTYQLVKSDFKCTSRGKITAKHKGEIEMYFVETKI